MKILFILLLSISGVFANILFIGNSTDKYICNEKEFSPLNIQSCNKIIAITDISFCYFRNSELGCKKLFKNESINMNNIDNETLTFDRLLSFNTIKKTTFGIKRFSNIGELSDILLPQGYILKPNKDMQINFNNVKTKKIKITHKNNILYSISTNKKSIFIKKKFFNHNKKYTLHIFIDKKEYTTNFTILDKETQNDVLSDIFKNTKNIENTKSLNLIKSIIYDQYGLSFDRNSILKETL